MDGAPTLQQSDWGQCTHRAKQWRRVCYRLKNGTFREIVTCSRCKQGRIVGARDRTQQAIDIGRLLLAGHTIIQVAQMTKSSRYKVQQIRDLLKPVAPHMRKGTPRKKR